MLPLPSRIEIEVCSDESRKIHPGNRTERAALER